MNATTTAAAIVFVLLVVVHLYVLSRAVRYRTDRDAGESSLAQLIWIMNQPLATETQARYLPDGHRWVSWVWITNLLAAAGLVFLVVSFVL